MLYRILKIIVAIGIRLFYKEIKVMQRKKIPETGPCVYIANHPNTLMDAWIIGHISKRPIYFMAKGTLFSSPLKNKILRSFNMIPINRRGDGATSGVSNHDSFEACYQILQEGKCLLIFPEGTSYLERHLRELKTGAARIALEAEKRNARKLNIQIVPLGLNYSQADRFRSTVLLNVGTPVSTLDYIEEYEQNQSQAAKKMTEQFRIHLEQVLVNSSEKEEEILTDQLHRFFSSKYIRNENKGVEGDVKLLKEIRDRITEISVTQAWKINEIKVLLDQINWKLAKYEIRADFLDRRFRSRMFFRQLFFSILFLIIGLPLFVYGLIHNFMQYKLTDVLVPKLTKEVEYYAPIAVLLGLVLYPLTYLAFMFTARAVFDLGFWYQLSYFASMPISGLIAYSLFHYLRHISFKWRFIFLMMNDQQTLMELKEEREQLRKMIFEH